jgi:hypothetical protein
MALNRKMRSNNIPFVMVPFNCGSTSYYDNTSKTLVDSQKCSFGRPKWFTRINITSLIYEFPIAFVVWSPFVAKKFTRQTYQGHFTKASWNEEEFPPLKEGEEPYTQENGFKYANKYSYNPFIKCDDIKPSRFVVAYETNLDAAFIALDQENMGDNFNNEYTDLGDDVLYYKRNISDFLDPTTAEDHVIHPNLTKYLGEDIIISGDQPPPGQSVLDD